MAYRRANRNQGFVTRVGVVIAVCTAGLTLSLFGLVAFVVGSTPGVGDRIPFYALGMALSFVSGIVWLEDRRSDPERSITLASLAAAAAFTFLTLAGEGLLYAARNPAEALAPQQFLYLVAAGLIATGVGYWGAHHAREMTALRL